VGSLETSGGRGAGVAAGVHDVLAVVVLCLVEEGLDAGLGVAPGAGVEGLLLGPDDGLGVGVLVEVLAQLLPREGVELLDAGEGDVVDVVGGAVLVQRGVHLARAQHDAVDLVVRLDLAREVRRVRDDPLELRVADKLVEVGTGERVAQQRLGEEEDES
jgi:hypothetical protein